MNNNLVNEILKEIIENSKVVSEGREIKTKELPPIQFPSVFINELLWGKRLAKGDSLKKEESRKFITMLGAAMKSAGGGDTPIGRVTALQEFLDKPADPNLGTREILANLMFLDVFSSVVNDFNAAVAGFLFEALFAGIFEGYQIEAIKGGGEHGTVDVGMEVTYRTGLTNYSFKLIGPNTPIGGSFTDLIDGVSSDGEEGHVRYLVVVKDREGESKIDLIFHDFEIRADNWFDWIGHEQKGKEEQEPAIAKTFEDFPFTLDTIDQLGKEKKFKCNSSWADPAKRCSADQLMSVTPALGAAELEEIPPPIPDLPGEEEAEALQEALANDVEYEVVKPQGTNQTWVFDEKGNKLASGTVLQPNVKYRVKEVIEKVKRTAMKTLYADFGPGGDKEEWFKTNKGVDFYTWINEKHYAEDSAFFDTLKCLSSYRKDKPDFCPGALPPIVEKKQAGEVSHTQFEISQEHMRQYAGQRGETAQTITLDANKYFETAKGYSSVMGNHVAAIFTALKKLIDDINCYYLEEKLSERQTCAIGAMDNAISLKTNINKYVAITTLADSEAGEELLQQWAQDPDPTPSPYNEQKQPGINLNKLIEQMIEESSN
tara:strand:+ start:420 stop:2222 length:1803 start_codon:yes stop_codon:yes gene_type:complete